jgi:hypothetical protein
MPNAQIREIAGCESIGSNLFAHAKIMFEKSVFIILLALLTSLVIISGYGFYRRRDAAMLIFFLAFLCALAPTVLGFFFAQTFYDFETKTTVKMPFFYISKLFQIAHALLLIGGLLVCLKRKDKQK